MKSKITFAVLLSLLGTLGILNTLSQNQPAPVPAVADLAIGEISIKIQDAVTGNPIPEMYVYRKIATQHAPGNTGRAKPRVVAHPADYAITDKDGIAVFPAKSIPRKHNDESIRFMEFDVNLDFDVEYDRSDASAHEKALGDSWRSGGGVFSENKKNDALRLSLFPHEPPSDARYEVLKSENPRCALVMICTKFDFNEQPHKIIVIKLGNASLIENGIKTEVTLKSKE